MLTKSEKYRSEYCAQIVKIGEVIPIEGSDFLSKTIVNGNQIVVGKNDVKTNDIMVYCKLETAINKDFLSVNNQFELSERSLNKNYEEVEKLINEGKTDEAKKLVGYFNKYGRVRIVKLRGCHSEGCLFTIDSISKWDKNIAKYDFSKCFEPNEDGVVVPFEFDTINGKLFVEAYVPKTYEPKNNVSKKERKRNKRIEKLDRMVDGQFNFHYDTGKLQDNMWKFNQNTNVVISTKLHGTSFICGNILTKKYKPESTIRKMIKRKLYKELDNLYKERVTTYWGRYIRNKKAESIKRKIETPYKLDYGEVTSSRGVIRNKYINKNVGRGFYSFDVYSEYGNLIYPYIQKGLTVYGEIVGYVTNSQNMIQKGYDYGCKPGENYLMPYRITFTDTDGNHTEWNVSEVYGWTLNLIKEHPELKDKIKPINIMYKGTLGNLYPDIDKDNHWNKNVLQRMSEDKEHFGMELNEPMCINKVPREGIVIRIDDDSKPEAFKLKCKKFLFKEAEQYDKGEVDIEAQQGY